MQRSNPCLCAAHSSFLDLPVASVRGASSRAAGTLQPGAAYTPTALLKVSGPEQMRQEWLASKETRAYAAMLAHVHALAHPQSRPVSSLVAGRGDDDD